MIFISFIKSEMQDKHVIIFDADFDSWQIWA